jgi:hypothetical protein
LVVAGITEIEISKTPQALIDELDDGIKTGHNLLQ